MRITLLLACLGVATLAATLLWLHLANSRRRMVVVVHGPANWSLQRDHRPAPRRNTRQQRSIPQLRVVA